MFANLNEKATRVTLSWNLSQNPDKLLSTICRKMQISRQKMKNRKSIFHSRKHVDDFWLTFWMLSGANICKSCGSRQELSNEYLLVKIGVDTAENEPLKIWRKIQFIFHSPPYSWRSRPTRSRKWRFRGLLGEWHLPRTWFWIHFAERLRKIVFNSKI